jgi:addiction module HigA family antidote
MNQNRVNRKRPPAHPGRILKNLYLTPLQITNTEFAKIIGVSRKAISSIINGHKSITPEMALRISKALPNASAESWLNLQKNHDLWNAAHQSDDWRTIKPIPVPANKHLTP